MDDETMMAGDDESYPLALAIVTGIVAVINFVAAISCFLFCILLLSKKEVRRNAYNLYVIFLVLPDGFNTFMTGLGGIFFATNDGLYPLGFFQKSLFCYMFYYTSNLYLNTVVAYEINKLVELSYKRIKTSPPTILKVYKQIIAVYIFSIIWSFWVSIDAPWSLTTTIDSRRGKLVFGSPNENLFSEMIATAIAFILLLIPIIYVVTIRIRIWKKKLLPRSGRTKVVSLFFLRIIVVFLGFYLPNTILDAIFATSSTSTSSTLVINLLTALQALVTLYMASFKEDIWQVVVDSTCCVSFVCKRWGFLDYITRDTSTTVVANQTSGEGQDVSENPWEATDVYDTSCGVWVESRNISVNDIERGREDDNE